MKGYWQRLGLNVRKFSEPEDRLICVKIYRSPKDMECQLCGHSPIRLVHVLRNERTKKDRSVGRECIYNYKRVGGKLGGSSEIVFPEKFRIVAENINKVTPGTVRVVADDFLDTYEENFNIEEYLDPVDMDIDNLSPEGTAFDEVDWDSYDWDDEDE